MGDQFNYLIDNLIAACWRLLELPLFVLISCLIVLFLFIWKLLTHFQNKHSGKALSARQIAFMLVGFFLIGLAIIIDHKIVETLNEVREARSNNIFGSDISQNDGLNESIDQRRLEEIKDLIRRDSSWFELVRQKAESGNIDLEQALSADAKYIYRLELERAARERVIIYDTLLPVFSKLEKLFGEVKLKRHSLSEGVELYMIKIEDPLVHGFLSVIDLSTSNLEINITEQLREKYLTSEFSETNGCLVAINGEAGQGPGLGSGFGAWIGNWIVNGSAILLKDNADRPFIAFDRKKKASYYQESVVDTVLSEEKYNAIWGRFDIMIDGKNLNREPGFGQPRTIMGINEPGNKLYLLVIDGRQPGYSMGLGLKEAANILEIFGASDAMACDQGGSSCMYVKSLGGIINQPADGIERLTYSHFGISVE